MKDYKAPIQSLIDHIKTAIDVDDWAKEMAEELLKEQKPKTGHWVFGNSYGHAWMKCSNCCVSQSGQTACWSYCPNCGARMEGQVVWE